MLTMACRIPTQLGNSRRGSTFAKWLMIFEINGSTLAQSPRGSYDTRQLVEAGRDRSKVPVSSQSQDRQWPRNYHYLRRENRLRRRIAQWASHANRSIFRRCEVQCGNRDRSIPGGKSSKRFPLLRVNGSCHTDY
ncbi:unnamed protein product [Nesidiocoris tenuis]|uniref:Uncharacterized protein n=1 Tax=Nesidiocoris tenuis TaxID=355587 RepID=A0A6H5H7Z0_9HEMI|nr:unnamed protein product [Nesidiocoris tenuis]